MPSTAVIWGCALLLAVCAAVRLVIGGWGATPEATHALLEIRGSRVVAGGLAGACLAVAGALLQGLLRNGLASPDLLGLASGAGLGVMVAVYVGFLGGAGLADTGGIGATGAAIAGACATLGLVYVVSRDARERGGGIAPTTLVLMGVIIAIICSGLITLLKHLMPDQGVAAGRLLVGNIREDVTGMHIGIVATLFASGLLVSLTQARAMDIASLSDDEATSVGVKLARLRGWQFAIAGTLTAGAVVLAGPVGFVGLLCPHVVRLLAGPRTKSLLIGSALMGAATVVAADCAVALVREINPGLGRLPLGVLTALVGGPIFLALLQRGSRWGAGAGGTDESR